MGSMNLKNKDLSQFPKEATSFSKFLARVLRHQPEEIGLTLDKNGYVRTDELIKAINDKSKYEINLQVLSWVVEQDEKGRYSFKDGQRLIRANQGHSTAQVDLEFKEYTKKDTLYHGTSKKNLKLITESGGLKPMSRQYVHLSKDLATASKVGSRHGELVVLLVNTEKMMEDGFAFFESENGVVLTKEVPMKYITIRYEEEGNKKFE